DGPHLSLHRHGALATATATRGSVPVRMECRLFLDAVLDDLIHEVPHLVLVHAKLLGSLKHTRLELPKALLHFFRKHHVATLAIGGWVDGKHFLSKLVEITQELVLESCHGHGGLEVHGSLHEVLAVVELVRNSRGGIHRIYILTDRLSLILILYHCPLLDPAKNILVPIGQPPAEAGGRVGLHRLKL